MSLNEDKKCDMGCGQIAKFSYKSGKSYCCKFGAKCPIKVEKDRQKKLGKNPFEGIEHHRCRKGKSPYNKGLTKETSELVANNGLAIKAFIDKNGHNWIGKHHSQESKAKLSEAAKKRKLGGYVRRSGRGKKGWHKGIFCDSSWELAYVIYFLEHNILIERNTIRRTYEFKGKTKNYIPDFLVNGQLIEIKGYVTDEWKAKLAYNSDVKPLYKNDLNHIIKYVIDKYGKKFISLYEP